MKQIRIWKCFEPNESHIRELQLQDNKFNGTFFKSYMYIIKNKEYIVFVYTGFPCGSIKRFFSQNYKELEGHFEEKIEPINELYKLAISFGFHQENIDNFINNKQSCFEYDDNDALVRYSEEFIWK